jgi:hypothetical protein
VEPRQKFFHRFLYRFSELLGSRILPKNGTYWKHRESDQSLSRICYWKLCDLENIFARASRLVLFIHRNLELLKKYTNNIFPVWVLTMTINLILNIYFLVKYSDYNIYALSMLQVRTITLILYLWTMLYFHDMQLIDPVSKLSVLCCPQKKNSFETYIVFNNNRLTIHISIIKMDASF